MSSATAELVEEITSVEENTALDAEELSELLPPTHQALEIMGQAGVSIPMAMSSEMSGFWNVSL